MHEIPEGESKLKKKIYAVRKGCTPGFYDTWREAEGQVRRDDSGLYLKDGMKPNMPWSAVFYQSSQRKLQRSSLATEKLWNDW